MKTTAIRLRILLLCLGLLSPAAGAQISAAPVGPASTLQTPTPAAGDFTAVLPQLQILAQTMNMDLLRLRIEKWKADAGVKKQAQTDADSVSRNLTAALPEIVEQARSHPQSLAAGFKLYRNLNALCDVFSGLAESTGAFGPKNEYDSLAGDLASLEDIRRTVGERLENLAAATDLEVTRLRTRAAQAIAAAPPPPTKIVVDEDTPPKKTTTRKKNPTPKPAAPSSSPAANSTSTSTSNPNGSQAKPQ